MVPLPPIRFKAIVLVVCVLVSLVLVKLQWRSNSSWRKPWTPPLHHLFSKPMVGFQPQLEFWQAFEFLLVAHGPTIKRPEQKGNAPAIKFDANMKMEYPEFIEMKDDEVQDMQLHHENFVKAISVHPPKLVYNAGTRGIVVTAGGPYLPLPVVTLRILKRLGSTLPMEIFLGSNSEYESHICENVLPRLNARCIILSEILFSTKEENKPQISRFQLKIFAMLFSSFEEILFLDADSWPVADPLPLFKKDPYKSTGMVLWPDFWYASQSQYYYQISHLPRPEIHSRASTESGEILLSKKTHAKTLLLAAYYNFWGPEHYYPLLTQGGPGEGDKETFLAAAQAAQEPYYAVSEKIVPIGHPNPNPAENDGVAGFAMVQFDPVQDYVLTQKKNLWRVKDPSVAPCPRPLFVHSNFPKLNPGRVYDDGLLKWEHNGSWRRAFTDRKETMELFGGDVERMYWEEAEWVACKLERKFQDWYKLDGQCGKARSLLRKLFGVERGD